MMKSYIGDNGRGWICVACSNDGRNDGDEGLGESKLHVYQVEWACRGYFAVNELRLLGPNPSSFIPLYHLSRWSSSARY